MEEPKMKAQLKRLLKRDGGFTLTELAVAMVVVGILASIAVPSFLGARNNAYDREAQAAVDAALIAASTYYAETGDFTALDTEACSTTAFAKDLQNVEPNYEFIDGEDESTNPRIISVKATPTFNNADDNLGCQAFFAAVMSRSGTCWVGRLTVEGSFLASSAGLSDAPVKVSLGRGDAGMDAVTDNNGPLDLNGRAYGAMSPVSPTAETTGGIEDSRDLASDACSGDANAFFDEAGAGDNNTGLDASEYFVSWRAVQPVASASIAN
jgi:prepilin-type N-terminal cleavage/methylation domain-containing protein